MSIVGSVAVKVTPKELVTQAEEVRRLGNDMKKRFDLLEDIMKKTKYYWLGEAGELHRKLYEEQKADISQMLRRLLEHPDDLLMISGNYKAAESKNVQSALTLDADVIS